jgi:hypothetical protein
MSRDGRVVAGPCQAPATGKDRAEGSGTGRRIPASAECTPSEPRSDASPAALAHASEGSALFNYGALDADVATLARETAKRIGDRTRSSFIENGRDLLAVKAKLEHGMFGKWLKAEFSWSERTAQSMMTAAGLADKSAIVADLPVITINLLAAPSTPEAAREEIIARFEQGAALSPKEIKGAIGEAKEREGAAARERAEKQKLERRLAGKSPQSQRRILKYDANKQQQLLRIEREAEEKRQQTEAAAAEAVELLKRHLGQDLQRFRELFDRAGYQFARKLRSLAGAQP